MSGCVSDCKMIHFNESMFLPFRKIAGYRADNALAGVK